MQCRSRLGTEAVERERTVCFTPQAGRIKRKDCLVFVRCAVWRMGSMADVNTSEKTAEVNEGLDQAVPALEGSMPGREVLHAPMPDPKSPEGKGDQPDEADLEILEPPEKKIRFSLEESFEKLMDRTQEGFDLTRGALEKVQQHLDLSKKVSQDLSQLAQEVHCEKIGAKYHGATPTGTVVVPKPGMAGGRYQE